MGKAESANYYDEVFKNSADYHRAHTDAPWAPLWNWIADRVQHDGRVLDCGCGPGHLIALLVERGLAPAQISGVDFSEVALLQARARAPGVLFEVGMLPEWIALHVHKSAPAWVIFCEILEHVEDDRGCIQNLLPGTHVVATVPDFDCQGHVRLFANEAQIRQRYEPLLDIIECERVGERHFGFVGRRADAVD